MTAKRLIVLVICALVAYGAWRCADSYVRGFSRLIAHDAQATEEASRQ